MILKFKDAIKYVSENNLLGKHESVDKESSFELTEDGIVNIKMTNLDTEFRIDGETPEEFIENEKKHKEEFNKSLMPDESEFKYMDFTGLATKLTEISDKRYKPKYQYDTSLLGDSDKDKELKRRIRAMNKPSYFNGDLDSVIRKFVEDYIEIENSVTRERIINYIFETDREMNDPYTIEEKVMNIESLVYLVRMTVEGIKR